MTAETKALFNKKKGALQVSMRDPVERSEITASLKVNAPVDAFTKIIKVFILCKSNLVIIDLHFYFS